MITVDRRHVEPILNALDACANDACEPERYRRAFAEAAAHIRAQPTSRTENVDSL